MTKQFHSEGTQMAKSFIICKYMLEEIPKSPLWDYSEQRRSVRL